MPKRIPRYIGNHLAGAYLLLVCSAAIAFAVLLLLYKQNADDTKALAKQSIQLSMEIQQQRREAIRLSCEEQNQRHKDLEDFLRSQSENPSPVAFQFIDKLAPLQDCDEVVKAATSTDEQPQG